MLIPAIHIRPSAPGGAVLLSAALRRSFTEGLIRPAGASGQTRFTVFAGGCRAEELRDAIRATGADGGKILVTGLPDAQSAPLLGLKYAPGGLFSPQAAEAAAQAEHNLTDPFHESPARIRYADHPLALASPLRDRPFCRYDYAEWNNLGFGAVRCRGAFGVSCGDSDSVRLAPDGAVELASMFIAGEAGEEQIGPYMALLDLPGLSILWCARPVGPLDSVEWQVVERFFSDWRAGELPCLPYLLQTPAGAGGIAVMRLDCDEAVASARELFALYQTLDVPFSLAVKTEQPLGKADLDLLRAVHASGGSLLSHSHTHAQGWGPCLEAVLEDARRSRRWFRENLPEIPVPGYAVSPFHSNPPYAAQGLEQAGFSGFVGGIIDNDPEFLLGRAGLAPFTERLLSISQQSMLHGDSYRNQGYNVKTHLEAFNLQYQARGIFGWLDHPFSERYHYGWDSEAQRLEAHARLIAGIREKPDALFWNQEQCFAFAADLTSVRLRVNGKVRDVSGKTGAFALQYRYEQEEYPLRR